VTRYVVGVLQRVAVCCSVLQCIAVCCSVLQHVEVRTREEVVCDKVCVGCVAVCGSFL